MTKTYESERYETVDNFRVEACERAFLFKKNPLYRSTPPWEVDQGFNYSSASLPKGKFASIDEALAATRKAFNGR